MTEIHATSPERPDALPDAWVSRIFSRMEALYGSAFSDRWRNTDMVHVRSVWAEELAGFFDQPSMIGHALKALSSRPTPPSLPEFLDLCRQAPRPQRPAIEGPKLTPDEQRERAQAISKAVDRSAGFDFLGWAKRPGSALAMREIVKCAERKDDRFVAILAQLKADGVCDESGKLLKRWDGLQWVRA